MGSALVTRLLKDGNQVCSLGRRVRPDNLPSPCDYIQADLTSYKSYNNNFEIIIHTAVIMGEGREVLTANQLSTYAALELALACGATKFIYLSSLPVIGHPLYTPIDETHPVHPSSIYHLSKYAGELMAALPRYNQLRPVILRIGSPVGPGKTKGGFVPALLSACRDGRPLRLYGHGTRVQNYIDVNDIANAVASSCAKPDQAGLFLISGHSLSNLDMARLCLKVTGATSDITMYGEDPDDHTIWKIDGTKAATLLGYQAKTSTEDSLRRLYEAWR